MPSTSRQSNKVDYSDWLRFKYMLTGIRQRTGWSERELSRRLVGTQGYTSQARKHRSLVGPEEIRSVERMAVLYGVPTHPRRDDRGLIPLDGKDIEMPRGKPSPLLDVEDVQLQIQKWPPFLPAVAGRNDGSSVTPEEMDIFRKVVLFAVARGESKPDVGFKMVGYGSNQAIYFALQPGKATGVVYYRNLISNFVRRYGVKALLDIVNGGNGIFPEIKPASLGVVDAARVVTDTPPVSVLEQMAVDAGVQKAPKKRRSDYGRPKKRPGAPDISPPALVVEAPDTFGRIASDLSAISERINALGMTMPKGIREWVTVFIGEPINKAIADLEAN